MYCEHCGLKNEDDSAFCAECGTPLQPVVVTPQVATPFAEVPVTANIDSVPSKKGIFATVFKQDIENFGKRRRVYQVLLSMLLCLILFLSSLCLNLIVGCKKTISEDNLTSVLNDIDIEEISLLDEAEFDLTEEAFYLLNDVEEFANMSEDDFSQYIDQPVFKKFIAKKVSQIITDFLTDDGSFKTKPREIMRLFDNADNTLMNELNVYIPYETYEQLSITISKSLNEIEPAEENDFLNITQSIFDTKTSILLYVIVFTCIILIWFANGMRFLHFFNAVSINSIIVGLTLVSTKLLVYLFELALNPDAKEFAVIEEVLSFVTGSFATTGIILLIIGVVLYVSSFIIARVIRKRVKTEIPKEA